MCGQAASSSGGTPSPVTAEIRKKGRPSSRARCSRRVDALGIVDGVDLVGGDELRLLEQVAVVERRARGECVSKSSTGSRPDAPDTSTRWISTFVRSMWRRNWWPEPVSLVRPFDQPGHVGDDEAALAAHRDDAEIGRERRERIVGNLRLGRRDARDERRLAGVGEADEADVGEQLQLQPEMDALRRVRPADACAGRGWSTSRSARCPVRRVRPSRRARARRLGVRSATSSADSGMSGIVHEDESCRPARGSRGRRRRARS